MLQKKTETPGSLLENVWDIFFKTHHGCSGHLPDIKQLQHVVQAWAISKQWQFYTPPEMQKKCISQPLGNHYHDISCSNDIKCSFLHGNLQSCNYNNNNLTTKKQKTTAEGGHQLFFPCVFPAEKSQTKSRFNDLSGAVAAEFPGLMISFTWQMGNPQMVIGHTSSNDYNDSFSNIAVSSFFRSFQVFHWWSWFMIPKLSKILHSLTLGEAKPIKFPLQKKGIVPFPRSQNRPPKIFSSRLWTPRPLHLGNWLTLSKLCSGWLVPTLLKQAEVGWFPVIKGKQYVVNN